MHFPLSAPLAGCVSLLFTCVSLSPRFDTLYVQKVYHSALRIASLHHCLPSSSDGLNGWEPQGNTLISLTDLALGVALPIHAHIGLNGILSDYVPPRYLGAHRCVPRQSATARCYCNSG